ncbi:MAG: protein kinase [Pyrinomonadaceae bacterium]
MLQPETILQNRYRIVRPLGRGGMGAVYEAIDKRLNRTVAIKQTLVTADELRRAFEREAHLLANLRHPALPNVIDHFSEGEELFLVMEYIPGRDLGELLAERNSQPFAVAEVCAWADQLLDALNYLHTLRPPVIHRDIKPANLKLLTHHQIVLLDFGLAKGASGQMSTVTATHSILGYTPSYAPLEQIQGAGTDTRSDLYALAATIYHLLTDTRPPDALQRANAVLHAEPDPLRDARQINSAIGANLSALLAQTMALNSAQRPASALAMRQALRDNAAQATIAERAASITDAGETTIVTTHTRPPESRPPESRPVPITTVARPQQVVVPIGPAAAAPTRGSAATARRAWTLTTLALAAVASLFVGWAFMRYRERLAAPPAPARRTVNRNVNQSVGNSNQNVLTETPAAVPTPTLGTIAERARRQLLERNLPFTEAAFYRVVENGEPELVRLYLAAEINPNAADARGRTALRLAAENGRDHIAQELLAGGADVNSTDARRTTALMAAAARGHTDTSRVLVERGADLDALDEVNQTALLKAAKEGHEEIVSLLINKGAEVNLRDASDRSARQWAEINRHQEIADLLRRAGAR